MTHINRSARRSRGVADTHDADPHAIEETRPAVENATARGHIRGNGVKHSLKNILRTWPLEAQQAFFEKELAQPLHLEEETGKPFPSSNRARDVRDGLVHAVEVAGVEFRTGTRVVDIASPDLQNRSWNVKLGNGDVWTPNG